MALLRLITVDIAHLGEKERQINSQDSFQLAKLPKLTDNP